MKMLAKVKLSTPSDWKVGDKGIIVDVDGTLGSFVWTVTEVEGDLLTTTVERVPSATLGQRTFRLIDDKWRLVIDTYVDSRELRKIEL